MSATCVEGVKKRDWRSGFNRMEFRVAAAVRGSWVLESWKGVELAGLEGCVRLKRDREAMESVTLVGSGLVS